MRIGQLADQVGVNPKTIRYYESIGLIPEPDRTSAGYRIYAEADVDRVAFVRRAQQLGLNLDEIAEILALRERGQRPCGYVLQIAEARLAEIDRRITEMQHARSELHELVQHADDLVEDGGDYCQLIEHQPPAPADR
jgi:DNA-binding transcriptional MerR regulator